MGRGKIQWGVFTSCKIQWGAFTITGLLDMKRELFAHPIQEKQFELIFNVDSAQGTSGSTGLKFVALAGYVSEECETEKKKKKTKK